jgi:RyR domain
VKFEEKNRPPESPTTDALARAMHDNYVAQEWAKGDTREQNPSLVSWEDLPESLKESNRGFAEGIRDKLEAVGCVVVPLASGGSDAPFRFSNQEVELLAGLEHDRWAADLVRDGWSPGPVKDHERREHTLLVPWSDLPESEREKDRASIRGLPEILTRAGFAIQRVR